MLHNCVFKNKMVIFTILIIKIENWSVFFSKNIEKDQYFYIIYYVLLFSRDGSGCDFCLQINQISHVSFGWARNTHSINIGYNNHI